MATNFEVYKDELSNVLAQREGRCIVMEVDDIMKRGFHRFCKGSDCGECWRELFKYLAEEHIEHLKLTKRERAFCEIVGNKVIARDEDGALNLFWNEIDIYKYKPSEGDGRWMKKVPYSNHITIDSSAFSFIKWEDEKPWSVEDMLKLDVIEEGQHETT